MWSRLIHDVAIFVLLSLLVLVSDYQFELIADLIFKIVRSSIFLPVSTKANGFVRLRSSITIIFFIKINIKWIIKHLDVGSFQRVETEIAQVGIKSRLDGRTMNSFLCFVGNKSPSHRSTNMFTNTSPAASNFLAFRRKIRSIEHTSVARFVETMANVRTDIIAATSGNYVRRLSTIAKISVDGMIPDLCKKQKTNQPLRRRSARDGWYHAGKFPKHSKHNSGFDDVPRTAKSQYIACNNIEYSV